MPRRSAVQDRPAGPAERVAAWHRRMRSELPELARMAWGVAALHGHVLPGIYETLIALDGLTDRLPRHEERESAALAAAGIHPEAGRVRQDHAEEAATLARLAAETGGVDDELCTALAQRLATLSRAHRRHVGLVERALAR